jgi:dethiobiotin synthetase
MKAWFVTGTDTGVGKTLVSAALLHRLREHHARVAGMKPIAAGGDEDVHALRAASSVRAEASLVNPYALAMPASPHIAARRDGVVIEIERIVDAFRSLGRQADAVIVEGAGWFLVPLSESRDGGDLAMALGLPVVLVVGLRLGCLNHALLSAQAVAARGLRLAGWVANRVDPAMAEPDANLALLAHRLDAPCLGDLPHRAMPDAREMAGLLQLSEEFTA